jgi:hypothetical protein
MDEATKERIAALFTQQQAALDNQIAGFAKTIAGLQQQVRLTIAQVPQAEHLPFGQDRAEERTMVEIQDEAVDERDRNDVIGEGGSAAAYSLRYRNDGAGGVHRLEWIAKATDTDPDTGLPWPDDDWNEVLGGDAEIYVST